MHREFNSSPVRNDSYFGGKGSFYACSYEKKLLGQPNYIFMTKEMNSIRAFKKEMHVITALFEKIFPNSYLVPSSRCVTSFRRLNAIQVQYNTYW